MNVLSKWLGPLMFYFAVRQLAKSVLTKLMPLSNRRPFFLVHQPSCLAHMKFQLVLKGIVNGDLQAGCADAIPLDAHATCAQSEVHRRKWLRSLRCFSHET